MGKRGRQEAKEGWLTPGNLIGIAGLLLTVVIALVAGWQARRLAEETGQFSRAVGNIHLFGREIVAREVDLVYEVPVETAAVSIAPLHLAVSNTGDRTLRNAFLVIETGTISGLAVPDSLVAAVIKGALRGREVSREVQVSGPLTYITHSLGDITPRTAISLVEPMPLQETRVTIPASDSLPLEVSVEYSHRLRLTLIYDDAPPIDVRLTVAAGQHVEDSPQDLEIRYIEHKYDEFRRNTASLSMLKRWLAGLKGPELLAVIVRPNWSKPAAVPLYLGKDSVRTTWIGWED